MEITCFEPHPQPGAGPNYDPGQPDYLRMNFVAELVDMWPEGGSLLELADGQRSSFASWRAAHEPREPASEEAGGEDIYPPRSQVGRYLRSGLEALLAAPPDGVSVAIEPDRVGAIDGGHGGWLLHTTERDSRPTGSTPRASASQPVPVAPASPFGPFDEVLVTVGHLPAGEGSLVRDWCHDAPLVEAVFPVERMLAAERVPAGSRVAVRGFALSFIDAALALTEGRGGSFEPAVGSGGGPRTSQPRLRYIPGPRAADQPAAIMPFSRTGLPMLAKPDPAFAASIDGLAETMAEHREAILALPAGFEVDRDLLKILRSTASLVLALASGGVRAARGGGGEYPPEHAVAETLERLLDRPTGRRLDTSEVLGRIGASLEVGGAERPPGPEWALGESWRGLYGAIVARLGDGGLRARQWPRFATLAGAMERIAFGPPPVNVAKLAALIEAGTVDLSALAGGQLRSDGGVCRLVRGADDAPEALAAAPGSGSGNGSATASSSSVGRPVDVVVDAVLPPPGAAGLESAPLDGLIEAGEVRLAPGRRGIEICPDGRAVRGDGSLSSGLSVLGRPTEDWVIGNDTLSRSLHPHFDRWARGVVRRLGAVAVLG